MGGRLGWVADNVDMVILLNFGTFLTFFGNFNTHLVVFSLYLAIIKRKNGKFKKRYIKKNITNIDKKLGVNTKFILGLP